MLMSPLYRYVREGTLLGRKASPPESWAGHCGRNFPILSKKYEIVLPSEKKLEIGKVKRTELWN